MSQKAILLAAGVVFGLIALGHMLRIVLGWSFMVQNFPVPMWASGIAVVIMGYLAFEGFRLAMPTALLSLLPAVFSFAAALVVVSRRHMGSLRTLCATVCCANDGDNDEGEEEEEEEEEEKKKREEEEEEEEEPVWMARAVVSPEIGSSVMRMASSEWSGIALQ